MVKLHVKYKNQNICLYETTVNSEIDEILKDLVAIHNGKVKVEWICSEFEDLSKYGPCLPPDMQGLTPDQIADLKLRDEWSDRHMLGDNFMLKPDLLGKRTGKAPTEKYAEILTKTASEAKAKVSQKLVDANLCVTCADVQDALDMLKGAMMIAYPMELPSYEPVVKAFGDKELPSDTLFGQDLLDELLTDIWWANKLLDRTKKLKDYIGTNEKCKLIVKLQKKGCGPPGREPVLTEEQHRALMLAEFQRKEELKKLEEADDDSYLNSAWADCKTLQKSFQGLKDIRFNFR